MLIGSTYCVLVRDIYLSISAHQPRSRELCVSLRSQLARRPTSTGTRVIPDEVWPSPSLTCSDICNSPPASLRVAYNLQETIGVECFAKEASLHVAYNLQKCQEVAEEAGCGIAHVGWMASWKGKNARGVLGNPQASMYLKLRRCPSRNGRGQG